MKKMTNREILNAVEEQMYLEGKSDGTYDRYISHLEKMMGHFKWKGICELTIKEIREYLVILRRRYAQTTYNNHVAAIKYVYKRILLEENIDFLIPLTRVPKKDVIVPSDEEVLELLKKCDNYELKCILALAVDTGGRVSEIVKIEFKDIYRKQNKIRLVGKGNKERYVDIDEEMIKMLENYYCNVRESIVNNNYMFSRRKRKGHIKSDYVGRELDKLEQKIGMKKYTMHNLRKYYATKKYQEKRDIKYISKMMGHHDDTTQNKYISVDYEQYKTFTIKEIIMKVQKPR